MVAHHLRALVVLYQILSIFNEYKMSNSWATLSIFLHLPRMFLFADFRFEKWIGQVTMDLLDIIFTY